VPDGAVTVPVPDKTYGGALLSVSAHASDDVWATGWAQILDSQVPDPNKPGGTIEEFHNEPLLEHWNGRTWQRAQASDAAVLLTVTAVSASDVWAAGYTEEDQPVLLHFDGRCWSTAPARFAGLYGEFSSLVANGPDDVWAVGRILLDDNDAGHALVAHWDGHHWQQVATPAAIGELSSVVTVPGGIAVVGNNWDEGYGIRLVDNRWESLDFPAGAFPSGVLYSAGKPTVVGTTRSDQSRQLQPLVLTSRG
jgi:hypothetical protein